VNVRRLLKIIAKDRETSWVFTLGLCVPYFLFLIWMHAHHEMWRDEVHAWTLARMARSFWELVNGDRMYEGHPPLWFWYLHGWTWLTKSAWGLQVATIVPATGAAVILARFAPFPRFVKVLLLFSFHYGFELTVMSRNYVLGWFLLCCLCAAYHPLRIRHVVLGLVLALLSMTSFYGLVMSFFLLAYFILDQVVLSRSSGTPAEVRASMSPRTFLTLAIAAAAYVFVVIVIDPPDPNPYSPGFFFGALGPGTFHDSLYRLTAGYLPWRKMVTGQFWWEPYSFWDRHLAWYDYTGGALFGLSILALLPSWRLIVAYLGTVAVLQIFQQARMEGSPRHWAHYLMIFIALCWLVRTRYPKRSHWISTVVLTGIFLIQLEPFVVATVIDTRDNFSGARETAAFIRKAGLQDLPIVAGPDGAMPALFGYLQRDFNVVETDEVNQTVVFHARRRHYSVEALLRKAVEMSRDRRSPVLLIGIQDLPSPPDGARSTKLFTSKPGAIGDEVFTVYKLEAP
jgi:hypothetical protein